MAFGNEYQVANLVSKHVRHGICGGSHPGRGTRNTLLALGARCYLEILGPDPAQPPPERPRTRGIDQLLAARLVGWASATHPTVDATPVSLAAVPALVATLETPRGIFVLR